MRRLGADHSERHRAGPERTLLAAVTLSLGQLTACAQACGNSHGVKSGAEGDQEVPEPQVRWMSPVEVATGNAVRGPWRMNESRFDYVDDATVAASGAQLVGVAWADNRAKDIFFRSYDVADVSEQREPTNVSNSPQTFSWLPSLVYGPSGLVFVLWQEIIFSGGSHGGEILFSRSVDNGHTFSEPINLSNTTAGAGKGRVTDTRWDNGSLDLALGRENELFAVWTEYEGALRFCRSRDAGRSFSAPQRLAGSVRQPARAPALAVGPNGNLNLAWTVGEDDAADIHFMRSTDGGRTFSDAVVVRDTAGYSDTPSIAVDRSENLHLVNAESPAGPFTASHVVYARRPAGAAVFEPATILSNADALSEAAGSPSIAVGSDNHLFVTWELYPTVDRRPFGIGVVASADGGDTFTEPAIVPTTRDASAGFNGGLQGSLMDKLDVTVSGIVYVVHNTFLPERTSRITLIRGQHRD